MMDSLQKTLCIFCRGAIEMMFTILSATALDPRSSSLKLQSQVDDDFYKVFTHPQSGFALLAFHRDSLVSSLSQEAESLPTNAQ